MHLSLLKEIQKKLISRKGKRGRVPTGGERLLHYIFFHRG